MPQHPRFDPSDDLLDAKPAATLDLHGLTVAEAAPVVKNFLETWQRRSPGAVLHVITGKGRRSPAGAALLPAIRTLLKSAPRTLVRDWTRDTDDGGFLVRVS